METPPLHADQPTLAGKAAPCQQVFLREAFSERRSLSAQRSGRAANTKPVDSACHRQTLLAKGQSRESAKRTAEGYFWAIWAGEDLSRPFHGLCSSAPI